MNYGGASCCDSCFQQNMVQGNRFPYACCGATIPRLEPLIPVAESHRRVKAPRVSCHSTTRVANMKKKKNVVKEQCSPEDMSKLIEQINDAIETKPSKQKFLNKPRNGLEHPEDCCCVECDENEKTLSDNCEGDVKPKKISPKESCSVASSMAEKTLKNFMYDNPDLSETKIKKGCEELGENIEDDDMEVWILQCPKNFDPQQILNCELGKVGKKSGGPKVECSADRFSKKKTLAVISPEKAAEYELFCDKIQLIKPVGKIVVCEKYVPEKEDRRKFKDEEPEICSDYGASPARRFESDNELKSGDECNSSDDDVKPVGKKIIKKKLNDQQFTIETTVTVKNVDKKKGKKGSFSESSPEKKKKRTLGRSEGEC